MATFALASELHALSPAERSRVSHILIDDGDWTPEQIRNAMARALGIYEIEPTFEEQSEDWTKR